jgi:hypothetical protein
MAKLGYIGNRMSSKLRSIFYLWFQFDPRESQSAGNCANYTIYSNTQKIKEKGENSLEPMRVLGFLTKTGGR